MFISALSKKLLPNTKPRKNKVQQILVGHLTGDLAQVVQGFADVDGEKVACDADGEPVQHIHQAGLRGQECGVVTGVGDYRVVGGQGRRNRGGQCGVQVFQSLPFLGGDAEVLGVRGDEVGFGGGICNRGTLSATSVTVANCTALGGKGGNGVAPGGGSGAGAGPGLGGGLYNDLDAVITCLNVTVSGNLALGGTGGSGTPRHILGRNRAISPKVQRPAEKRYNDDSYGYDVIV